MTKRYHWACEICGKTGCCSTRPQANKNKKNHYKSFHPDVFFPERNANINISRAKQEEHRGISSGVCGEGCSLYTGKRICLCGNVSEPGTEKSCFLIETN